ncbi:MAG TPA: Wzz/FepE/Etk N-terminal domain-containing protein [Candidatus Limnocylindria bacterium]|nr:Wzz/FepE/Etk N-terminal domain-containing protein [Candidatus Limnocylindria bacterium]
MSHSPVETPTPRAPQATAREFLTVVFRRKWLIIGLFVVTTITVLVVAFATPMSYVSAGRVLVKRGEPESALNPYRRSQGSWEEELGSELEIIKSHPVVERAREILKSETVPGTATIPLGVGQVGVQVLGRSNALLITYEDRDPVIAQRACDAMVRAYIDYRQSLLTLGYPQRFFNTEIGDLERQLNEKVETRRGFSNRSGVVEISEQRRKALDLLGVLEQRQTAASSELAEARAGQRVMRELQDRPGIDLPVLSGGYANESALSDLKAKVVNQEARVAILRERYRDESSEVINANATLDTLRMLLRREVDARLTMSQTRVEILAARLRESERDVARVQAELATMPNKERTMSDLDHDIELLRNRYNTLTQQSDQARVIENTSPSITVLLLDPADAAVPKHTRDYVRLALAPAFSLVIGIGIAFFIDGLDLTVRTSGQAEQALDVPVLASLSERRRRRRPSVQQESHGL